MAGACAVDLEVADRSLRVDCCETGVSIRRDSRRGRVRKRLTGNCLKVICISAYCEVHGIRGTGSYRPTLEEASVKLFRVVLLPEEGLPTRPISGSRGIAAGFGSFLTKSLTWGWDFGS